MDSKIKFYQEVSYELKKVQPEDLFPQTSHNIDEKSTHHRILTKFYGFLTIGATVVAFIELINEKIKLV